MGGPLGVQKQARRLAVLAVAMAVTGLLRLGPSVLVVYLVAAAYVLGLTLLTFAPRYRRLVETLSLGVLIPAALPVSHDLYALLALVCTALVHHLVYGPPGQSARPRFTATATRKTRAGLPVDAVWVRLVPGSSHPDDFWTGTLLDYDADPDDPLTLYARFDNPNGLFHEATFTFLEADPPREARFLVEIDGLPEDEEMALHLRLVEEDRFSTLIESEAVRANMTLDRAVLLWFDDSMGDDWPSVVSFGARRRRWQVSRAAAGTPEVEVDVAEIDLPAPTLVHPVTPVAPPSPRPRILNTRLKDLPDPDDFQEPFDIMQLMEQVRA